MSLTAVSLQSTVSIHVFLLSPLPSVYLLWTQDLIVILSVVPSPLTAPSLSLSRDRVVDKEVERAPKQIVPDNRRNICMTIRRVHSKDRHWVVEKGEKREWILLIAEIQL